MSSSILRPLQSNIIRPSAFYKGLSQIWRQSQGRAIGLAISGGVDSMALASLCASWPADDCTHGRPNLVGFIVDHGLRENSSQEAAEVALELQRLHIDARVLRLDWRDHGDPATLPNLESVARKLRYRAIGTVCLDAGVDSLLLAHHADDQAETVMVRMLSNYLGTGLRGIREEAALPECEGLYGLHESGRPRESPTTQVASGGGSTGFQIEGGGISMHRPLLPYTKAALVATCVENGIKWFEDRTNADLTMTLRNTVRHLQQSDQLPTALRTPRLLELASSIETREHQREIDAQYILERMTVPLDTCIGRTSFSFKQLLLEIPAEATERRVLIALALRKLVQTVSPMEVKSLQDLLPQLAFLFQTPPDSGSSQKSKAQLTGPSVAGVMITRDDPTNGQKSYTLERAQPTAQEKQSVTRLLPNSACPKPNATKRSWTNWQRWDGRFWLRVSPPAQTEAEECDISVRFLAPTCLASLRETLPKAAAERLKRRLHAAPGKLRYTLPAIVQTQTQDSSEYAATRAGVERVVALPSLGWSVGTWAAAQVDGKVGAEQWLWDIRYKKV